jgi:putative transposase
VTDGIPPPSRNQRTPTAADTPACPAASSLDSPPAIAAQNRRRCSSLPTGGRPGERIAGLPARSAARRFAPIATPLDPALRRPIDFAQYTSIDYTQTLADHGLLASVGSVGDAYDNALAESFVDSFKTELIADRVWPTRAQLELAVVEYIGWFNDCRLHQAPGDLPPSEFERPSQSSSFEISLSGKEGTNKPGLRGTRSGSRGSRTAASGRVGHPDLTQNIGQNHPSRREAGRLPPHSAAGCCSPHGSQAPSPASGQNLDRFPAGLERLLPLLGFIEALRPQAKPRTARRARRPDPHAGSSRPSA